jgi:hypothetical protein
MVAARLEKLRERNGPEVRVMIFSAHRLMRNGRVECVRYYDRESPAREFIAAVRKRQLSSGAELTLMPQVRLLRKHYSQFSSGACSHGFAVG